MRKYLGRLDLEIRNIWITNECIDRVNLGYTTFYKNRACRRDLHRIQEININKVYIFRWLVITTLVAKKKLWHVTTSSTSSQPWTCVSWTWTLLWWFDELIWLSWAYLIVLWTYLVVTLLIVVYFLWIRTLISWNNNVVSFIVLWWNGSIWTSTRNGHV